MFAAWLFATLILSVQFCSAQEVFQQLYSPANALKHKIAAMTVSYYLIGDESNGMESSNGQADIREKFKFDSLGRVAHYTTTDSYLEKLGTQGPHQVSFFEYSENGNTCHRHDSTVFGNVGVWNFSFNSKHEPIGIERVINGNDFISFRKDYVYDLQGRLEKERAIQFRSNEGFEEECYWKFYIHDNQSFSATSLSPQELKECDYYLNYLDETGRTVREVSFDSLGNTTLSTVITYDRTGKPNKLVTVSADNQTVQRIATIEYEREGVVNITFNAPGTFRDRANALFSTKARDFVLSNWPSWRLLNQINLIQAEKRFAHYDFEYDLKK